MLFGLNCDFIQKDGLCMVLDEAEGLPVSKLNRVQTRMMVTTKIPNHLRLYLKEIDLKVTLEYAISGKRMLSSLLKSEKLSMSTFYGILLQIAQGMEEGRLYMLSPERYALHEDYIFMDGSLHSGKIYLAYVPILESELEIKPGESLRSLIMILMASISELKGNGVQRLLQYCGEEGFSSGGLKGLLAELLTEGSASEKMKQVAVEPGTPVQAVFAKEHEAEASERHPIHKVREQLPESKRILPEWTSGYSSFHNSNRESPDYKSASDELESELLSSDSNPRIYVALGCLLGAALVWKFLYLNHPSLLALIVCCGLSLVMAVISGVTWRGGMHLKSGSIEKAKDDEAVIKAGFTGQKVIENDRNYGRNTSNNNGRSAVTELKYEPKVSLPNRISSTDFMPDSGVAGIAPTALLSREPVPLKDEMPWNSQKRAPYLERSDGTGGELKEKIELNRPSFIIGRSTEVAQYIESSEGASRVHAEISKNGEGYILKDLDSRNGTIFQGEPMIPYKEYQLAEGDVFTIVKGSYTFHMA